LEQPEHLGGAQRMFGLGMTLRAGEIVGLLDQRA
jgi:hypothetical protein